MKPKEAVDSLDPQKWAETSAEEKLALLLRIQDNIEMYRNELIAAELAMRNIDPDDRANAHQHGVAMQLVIVPMAGNIAAAIDVYKELAEGRIPQPAEVDEVGDGFYDLLVFPISARDKVLYGHRKGYLRVKGEPKQVNPLDKDGGIIAVLGAGNYSSAFEMVRALFIDNCAVVHRPHHINVGTNAVWQKVFQPLVDCQAVSFCDSEGGRDLVKDERLTRIYFTGGAPAAKAIMANSSTDVVSECGGNNPCLIVPGEWTDKEIEHQAIQLVSQGKANGGAACGRVQTVVTSKDWPQRRRFLAALERAIRDETPGFTTYYPGSDETWAAFAEAYPEAKVIHPENGRIPNSEFMLIEDAEADGLATSREAFTQILNEVPLDTASDPAAFLTEAVQFANTRLVGTLAACILIDDVTLEENRAAVEQAVTDLRYGAIAVNVMPPFVWINPYLTWGGNEEGKDFVSGCGNFGNLMSFDNVEKSIIYSSFTSPADFVITNKGNFLQLSEHMISYAIRPGWRQLAAMTTSAFTDRLHRKDF